MDLQKINQQIVAISINLEEIFAKIKSFRTAAWGVAIFSIFNWRLGKAVAFGASAELFLVDFILAVVVWCGFVLFLIPLVHSISEKNKGAIVSVGETAKNINHTTLALMPFMPIAIILRAIGAPVFWLNFTDLVFRAALLWNITSVIKKSYELKWLKAFFVLSAPVWLFTLWLTAISILLAIWFLIKFL